MSNFIGIRIAAKVTANVVVTASTVLVTTGLTSPIAAGQQQMIRAWIPFSVGATGGVKLQIILPAAPTSIITTITLIDTVTPAQIVALQTTSTPFSNALAVAGSHWLKVEATIVNGVNAGTVDIQMACNSAANALTVFAGSWMDILKAS